MINARNVVVFDNEGIPSIMVRFDKCTNADLFEGGSNQTHPAFIIDGKEVDRIYIAKYPCTLINGKPYSLPFMKPATDIDFDEAAKACFSKGKSYSTTLSRNTTINKNAPTARFGIITTTSKKENRKNIL